MKPENKTVNKTENNEKVAELKSRFRALEEKLGRTLTGQPDFSPLTEDDLLEMHDLAMSITKSQEPQSHHTSPIFTLGMRALIERSRKNMASSAPSTNNQEPSQPHN